MGTALIQLKIMPESPDSDLIKIQKQAEKIIQEKQGQNPQFKTEPVAFGLNSITASFSIDESIPTDPFETKIKEIPNVSSAEIIDFRRAFG